MVTGRPARARAALGAWPWNLWNVRSLVAARREVHGFRAVGDREVRRHQVRGLVGPRLTLRRVGGGEHGRRFGASARRVAAVPVRGKMDVDPAAWSPGTVLVALAIAGVVAFGSRHLLTRFVPAVGELVPAGGGGGPARRVGAGVAARRASGDDGAGPGVAGALGLLGATSVRPGRPGPHAPDRRPRPARRRRRAPPPAPAGSKRAQVAAAVAYAAVPLPYDALAAGRWSALAAYAGAPWMLGASPGLGRHPFAPTATARRRRAAGGCGGRAGRPPPAVEARGAPAR